MDPQKNHFSQNLGSFIPKN